MSELLTIAYLLQEMIQKKQSGCIDYTVTGGHSGKIFVTQGVICSVTYRGLPITAEKLATLDVYKVVIRQNLPGPTSPLPQTPDALSVWQALQQEGGFTMAYLEVHAYNEAARELTLGNTLSIGRHTDNDIILHYGRVSRYHARLTRHGEDFLIEDLLSSNGTYLREQRLPPRAPSELQDGDEIRIDVSRFVFRLRRPCEKNGHVGTRLVSSRGGASEDRALLLPNHHDARRHRQPGGSVDLEYKEQNPQNNITPSYTAKMDPLPSYQQMVYLDAQGQGTATCPQCNTKIQVVASIHRNLHEPLEVKCSCDHCFPILFNTRRLYRKDVHLPGMYMPSNGAVKRRMIVDNLSMIGIQFHTLLPHSLQVDDVAELVFQLDDPQCTEMSHQVKICWVHDKQIGAEFCHLTVYERELSVYLRRISS